MKTCELVLQIRCQGFGKKNVRKEAEFQKENQ